jgi:hypothetical protein
MQSGGWPFPKQTLAEFNLNTSEGRSADSITYLLRASVCVENEFRLSLFGNRPGQKERRENLAERKLGHQINPAILRRRTHTHEMRNQSDARCINGADAKGRQK